MELRYFYIITKISPTPCTASLCLGSGGGYSQSTSRMTSISENEINIQIPLCNVRHLNGILKISLEIFPKKMHWLTKKIIRKCLGKDCYFLKYFNEDPVSCLLEVSIKTNVQFQKKSISTPRKVIGNS